MKARVMIVTVIIGALCSGSCAQKGLDDRESGKTSIPSSEPKSDTTIEGEIYIAGNEPFTRVAMSIDSSRNIGLEGSREIEKTLRRLQGERIRVTGTVKKGLGGDVIVIKEFYRVK